ncbi:hypothetical protein N9Z58_01265 [bacterium]|nr:hypothetical protein [bacterium]
MLIVVALISVVLGGRVRWWSQSNQVLSWILLIVKFDQPSFFTDVVFSEKQLPIGG